MKKDYKQVALGLLLSVWVCALSVAEEPLNIIYYGNSFTLCIPLDQMVEGAHTPGVKWIVDQMAAAAGHPRVPNPAVGSGTGSGSLAREILLSTDYFGDRRGKTYTDLRALDLGYTLAQAQYTVPLATPTLEKMFNPLTGLYVEHHRSENVRYMDHFRALADGAAPLADQINGQLHNTWDYVVLQMNTGGVGPLENGFPMMLYHSARDMMSDIFWEGRTQDLGYETWQTVDYAAHSPNAVCVLRAGDWQGLTAAEIAGFQAVADQLTIDFPGKEIRIAPIGEAASLGMHASGIPVSSDDAITPWVPDYNPDHMMSMRFLNRVQVEDGASEVTLNFHASERGALLAGLVLYSTLFNDGTYDMASATYPLLDGLGDPITVHYEFDDGVGGGVGVDIAQHGGVLGEFINLVNARIEEVNANVPDYVPGDPDQLNPGDPLHSLLDMNDLLYISSLSDTATHTEFMILASTSAVEVLEGSTKSFGVKLTATPDNSTTVTVAHFSGDTDITVQSGSNLVFTTENWMLYQYPVIAAAQDDDWANSSAVIRCSSDGLIDLDVKVTEDDDETNPDCILPFTETFEGLTASALAGQHSWTGGGTVQTSTVHGGSQALALAEDSVSHFFVGEKTNVWVTVWAQPMFSEVAGEIPSNAVAPFYINTNAQVVAYSNATPITLTGATVSNGWNKFEVFCDYSSKVWKLSLNGTELFADFAFYSDQAAFSAVELIEGTAGSSFFDDLEITDSQNDSDGDGLPDWWEIQYFGGATNANPLATASNGVNTVKQTYIAGLNPTNPDSFFTLEFAGPLQWTAVSGRVYSIYWTSNLLDGFGIPWETNITGGAYTDLTHGAENEGFYKIEVRVE